MKKLFVLIPLLSVVVFAGCANTKKPSSMEENKEKVIVEKNVKNLVTKKAVEKKEELRVIEVNASRFKFEPNEIRVKKGEKVALKINDLDTAHGAQFGEMEVWYEENGNIVLDTSTAGEYDFRCATMCGGGHMGMKGKVIVE